MILWLLTLSWTAAAAPARKAPPDPFCVSKEKRDRQKQDLKEKIERPDCALALRRLRLARVECSEPQTIRDFKSAVLGAVNPDDAYAEGMARALCQARADSACMNPEPQCRLKSFRPEPRLPKDREKAAALLRKYYLERLPDVSEAQAKVLADRYLELHGD